MDMSSPGKGKRSIQNFRYRVYDISTGEMTLEAINMYRVTSRLNQEELVINSAISQEIPLGGSLVRYESLDGKRMRSGMLWLDLEDHSKYPHINIFK